MCNVIYAEWYFLQATLSEAMINKKQGIHSVVISVGKWIDREEQIGIASHPYENNIFGVDKADDLQKIQDDMREHLCNSKNSS